MKALCMTADDFERKRKRSLSCFASSILLPNSIKKTSRFPLLGGGLEKRSENVSTEMPY